jgi:iron complex transport system substrate-binding protein
MRAFVCAWAISLLASTPAHGRAPQRVASLKLCTDELLLMLADPRQIASVTFLTQEPAESPLWRAARRYPKNDGSLLSVASVAPDLVVDMGGGGRDSARIAGRLGARVLNLPYPQSLSDIEASIRTLADALGRQAAGDAVLGRIAALKQSAPRTSIDAAWLGGGGRSLSAQGLGAEWMALSGLRQRRLDGDRLTLEQLVVDPPALLVKSAYRQKQYSAEQRWLSHPLVKRGRRSRTILTDGRRWTCMGPLMIEEVLRLRRESAR